MSNEKLNIQVLIDLLAEKHGMDKSDADSFVREFFVLIEEALDNDKYVKIKGLGVFKLIDVDSRESVNVNTGERYEIKEHAKVSFTPESALKEVINRPFSHFEAVELNDNTVFDDDDVAAEEDETKEENTVEAVEPLREESGQTEIENPLVEELRVEEKSEIDEVKNKEAKEGHPDTHLFPKRRVDDEQIKKEGANTMKYFIGVVFLVVALCIGAIFFIYFPEVLTSGQQQIRDEQIIGNNREIVADTIDVQPGFTQDEPLRGDSVAPKREEPIAREQARSKEAQPAKKTIPVVVKEEKAAVAKPVVTPLSDSANYSIEGTLQKYTLKEGETLTRVSLRFWGTKALWPYLVKHNADVIKNPDNVPWGTTIKIPILKKR